MAGKRKDNALRRDPFYKLWNGIKARCYYPGNISYKNYGAKGIRLSENWMIFLNFKKDMYDSYIEHQKIYGSKNTTIERIDSNKGYSVENCRWATRIEQNNNTSRNTFITYRGRTLSISQWSRIIEIDRSSLLYRLRTMPIEIAIKKKKYEKYN